MVRRLCKYCVFWDSRLWAGTNYANCLRLNKSTSFDFGDFCVWFDERFINGVCVSQLLEKYR